MRRLLTCVVLLSSLGCRGTVIEPGQRGLLFDPKAGGLKREVLQPGYHSLDAWCFLRTACNRIEVFDVSYMTKKEVIATTSSEGLKMDARVAVNYRPIIAELYELNTEIGQNYYDDIVAPEFRSAAMGVFSRHSYLDLKKMNEKLEGEIATDVRKRIKGKHVEISSVNIEQVSYAPDIAAAVEAKLVAEQEAIKNKAALEAESLRKKLELEYQAEQAKLKADLALKAKKDETVMAEEQAKVDKLKAESEASVRVTSAKGKAQEATILAEAKVKTKKAEYSHITPLVVQMHAYEALGKLGGNGTTILLGDWSRAPSFLFPSAVFPYNPPAAKSASVKPAVQQAE